MWQENQNLYCLLSAEDRKRLDQGYKASKHHCFRQRCKMVLLKAEGYTSKEVPYGWQFRDENISIQSADGKQINCFGMIGRDNDFVYETTYETINTSFIIEQLNRFSYRIKKHTVIVLDNASVHQSKAIPAMQKTWAKRRLFVFYLPPCSPHLNIIERLWKEMKARWIQTKDYEDEQLLFYSTKLILHAIGKDLFINFKRKIIIT